MLKINKRLTIRHFVWVVWLPLATVAMWFLIALIVGVTYATIN